MKTKLECSNGWVKIERIIDESTGEGKPGMNDMKIKRLAEALSSVAGVSARAAAISDRPFMDSEGPAGKREKRPLVVIGVTAQPIPGFSETKGSPVTINIDGEEQ